MDTRSLKVTIHQPDFLPWLGFFERWRTSDLLILLDDVQFLRRGWHHRDQIKTTCGITWLTVPTLKKGKLGQQIRQVLIDNNRSWRRKHLGLIKSNYARAPHFRSVFEQLEQIYRCNHETLLDLNMALLDWARKKMRIETAIKLSSDYAVDGSKTEKLVALCRKAGADCYLTGLGSRNYLQSGLFQNAGIKVVWHRFDHPVYPQLHGPFATNLSVLDFLMMEGGYA